MADSGDINSRHEPSVQCPFERRTLAETLKVKELGPDGLIYCEELFVKLFAVPQPHLKTISPAATVVLYDVIVWISTASTACLAPPTDSTLGSFEMSKICAEPVSGDLRFLSVAALTKSMMGNNLLTTQLNYHIASSKRDAAFSSKMFNFHIWCHVVVLKRIFPSIIAVQTLSEICDCY